jgi:hypothetical protein
MIVVDRAHRPPAPCHPARARAAHGGEGRRLALVDTASGGGLWAAELGHRGQQVHARLARRRACRRLRRPRHPCYRPERFANWRRPAGWLAPSLEPRVRDMLTWVQRLRRLTPVDALSQEFGTQSLENP